jgi:hypothetical protein
MTTQRYRSTGGTRPANPTAGSPGRRLNRTHVFLAALVLVLVGLFAPGWTGAIILFALAAGLLAVLVTALRAGRAGQPVAAVLVRLVVLAGLVLIALHKVS